MVKSRICQIFEFPNRCFVSVHCEPPSFTPKKVKKKGGLEEIRRFNSPIKEKRKTNSNGVRRVMLKK